MKDEITTERIIEMCIEIARKNKRKDRPKKETPLDRLKQGLKEMKESGFSK